MPRAAGQDGNHMMKNSRKMTILIVFIAGFAFGLTLLTVSRVFFTGNPLFADTNSTNALEGYINPEDENYFRFFPMFKETYNILKREFYDKTQTTAKKLIYGAIRGMMESVNDPYTTFMDPAISKEFSIDMTGSFGGLGIQIDIRDSWLTVISPMEDTPAWRAGIKPGDRIIEIEGKTTKGITVKQAVDQMRGRPGTRVTITLSRDGITDPFKITITREEIKLRTIRTDRIEHNRKKYAFIKILEFSMPTADEFRSKLQAALKEKPDGLIVDLRNNPGGLLNVVVNVADDFLSEGLIVYTRGRLPENNSDFYATRETTFVPANLPMVILINQGSASASEIFAGAMRDTGRAVLVGMKSFGKGSVQKTYTFQDDGSIIKYTVAKYFTPSGDSIDKKGIVPNIEEKMWYETLSEEERTAMVKIQGTNFVKEFLAKNAKPDTRQTEEFRKTLADQGFKVGTKSLSWLIKMKQDEKTMPMATDTEFDNQLSKALDVLDRYEQHKKPVKVFREAR